MTYLGVVSFVEKLSDCASERGRDEHKLRLVSALGVSHHGPRKLLDIRGEALSHHRVHLVHDHVRHLAHEEVPLLLVLEETTLLARRGGVGWSEVRFKKLKAWGKRCNEET